jgi:hypothetical protein
MLIKKNPYILVDTDKETPNVARAYTPKILDTLAGNKVNESLFFDNTDPPPSTIPIGIQDRIDALLSDWIVFSDDNRTEYLTRNLLSLSKFNRDLLINLPANVYQPVCDFIADNNLHQSSKIKLFNWWISNGSEESLDLFVETQAKFPQAKHILVLNQGNFQYVYDWRRFRLSKLISDLYQSGCIKVVRMPFLSVEPGFWQSQESVPYHDLIRDDSVDEFVRDAIETWMIKAFDEIDKTTWL